MATEPVVQSPRMIAIFRTVEKIARTRASVLITGETGSGKEVVARALHHYSMRCEGPWVDINCGALPEHLVESELFGHERGAFSGADQSKPGMFELAENGTLFLDEVAELDAKMQVKLLRVLDGAPYYRLGGTRKVSVDVRIVAATNVDLPSAIQSRRFREDLFHRLSQVHIEVPPLRDRPEEIAPLARHFLHQIDPNLVLSDDARQALEAYPWPGNVRELRNVVTRAAALMESEEIRGEDFQLESQRQPSIGKVALRQQLGGLEREAIMHALEKSGGRQDIAAGFLGISRRTLLRRLKEYRSQPAFGAADLMEEPAR